MDYKHSRFPCPSPSPRACSNSCPLGRWCHPTILSSVVPFSSHFQSFPASGSFPASQLFSSGGQSFGASASALVLPMNIQDWFPLGLTSWKGRGTRDQITKHCWMSLRLHRVGHDWSDFAAAAARHGFCQMCGRPSVQVNQSHLLCINKSQRAGKCRSSFCSVARIQNPCMVQQEPYGKNAVWFPPGEPWPLAWAICTYCTNSSKISGGSPQDTAYSQKRISTNLT